MHWVHWFWRAPLIMGGIGWILHTQQHLFMKISARQESVIRIFFWWITTTGIGALIGLFGLRGCG